MLFTHESSFVRSVCFPRETAQRQLVFARCLCFFHKIPHPFFVSAWQYEQMPPFKLVILGVDGAMASMIACNQVRLRMYIYLICSSVEKPCYCNLFVLAVARSLRVMRPTSSDANSCKLGVGWMLSCKLLYFAFSKPFVEYWRSGVSVPVHFLFMLWMQATVAVCTHLGISGRLIPVASLV